MIKETPPFESAGSVVAQWSRAIGLVGIPGVIAILVVWMGSQELPKLVQAAELNHQEALKTRDLLREHMQQAEAQIRLMRWICSGVQKNDDDRKRCFE